jgi:hypothetical protein
MTEKNLENKTRESNSIIIKYDICPYVGDVDCSGQDLHGECSSLSHYSCEIYKSKNIRRAIQ